MTTPSQPTSSKRRKPQSGSIAIQFRPGVPGQDLIFDNVEDVIDFIRDQTDSDVTVYINLSNVGGSYTLPVRTDYDFRRVFLDGFFNDDGSIPILRWPEGARIVNECNFIRKKDVDFECLATTTPIWRPTQSSRMEDETAAGYIATTNAVPFVSTAFMPAGGLLTYQGGAGCGLLNFGGTPLILITANMVFRAFLNETCEFQANTLASFVPCTVDLRLSTEAAVAAQPALVATTYTISCKEQSGAAFPARTYPGKLFHLTTGSNRTWFRNTTNSAFVQHAVPPPVEFSSTIATVTGATPTTYLSQVYNAESLRPHMITASWKWAGTNTAKNARFRLLIDGVPVGVTTNAGVLIMNQQPPRAGSSPNFDSLQDGDFNYDWTPGSLGNHTIDFQFFGEDGTTTITMARCLLRVEEAL